MTPGSPVRVVARMTSMTMTINLALGDDKTRRNWGVGDASIANKLGSLSIIYMVRYYIAS